MKLPLRYFLIISILLGAVAIPVGWRAYQKWKDQRLQAEVERLEEELTEAMMLLKAGDFLTPSQEPLVSPAQQRLESRVTEIEDRLEKLTGVRPERIQSLLEKFDLSTDR